MDLFHLLTILIVVSALFAYVNVRFLKLPDAIGIMLVSLFFSLIVLGVNEVKPTWFALTRQTIRDIDFHYVLFDVMLCFLLFAGAYHTDAAKLKVERRSVMLFAFVGVLLCTFFVGTLLYFLAGWIGIVLPYTLCLLFGALISPTDPIAVLGILAKFELPESVKTNIVGESLFNDGVAVVIFATLYQVLLNGSSSVNAGDVLLIFLQEAGGGVLFGALLGYGLYGLLRSIDHYQTEVLLTLAGVMGGYLLAHQLHVSGPLAMVVAGLFVGNRVRQNAMSEESGEYVDRFWELLDVVLNAILFVLIGVELLVIDLSLLSLEICVLAVLIVLASRYLSIIIPYTLARRWHDLDSKAPIMLTWGGLRGGLSIAMALSIDQEVAFSDLIVSITYAVVLFSVVGQGLTMERLIKRLYPTG